MAEIQCMSPTFREQLLELAQEAGVSVNARKMLEEIPDCEHGEAALINPECQNIGKPLPCKEGGRVKRAPSAYNIFIGDCMRAPSSKPMKECAADYKRQKSG